jgi:hypothetical protein
LAKPVSLEELGYEFIIQKVVLTALSEYYKNIT